MSKLLYLGGAALLAYIISLFVFGLGSFMTFSLTIAASVIGLLWLMKGLGVKYANGMPFAKKHALMVGAVLTGWVLISGPLSAFNVFGIPPIEAAIGGVPAGALTTTTAPSVTTQAGCSVTPELQGKAASVIFHTWNQEANNPYTTEVDLTTNCWLYKNGNSASNFVATTSDTSNAEQNTGLVVGDVLNVYCGGTSYYTEKVENHCITSQDDILELSTHAIDAETDIALTGYDETGSTALTAAGNTTTADYDITLGANEEKDFYVQVKVNSADASLNLLGFATAATNDIDYVMPIGSEFRKGVSVNFLESLQVTAQLANAIDNQTTDYDPYIMSSPVLFSEWDYKKYHFKIASNSGNPSATDNVFATVDAGIICILDATYAKGADGEPHLDFHDHAIANSESNVGLAETFVEPVGKNSCMVLEGN